MPRKPTGRGRGRPKGTGQLGEEGVDHVRLTVRLPRGLYDALEAAAEREHYTRDAPELARYVREAVVHYLSCPHRRQTEIVPQVSRSNTWQPVNVPETVGAHTRQPEILPTAFQPEHFQQAPAIRDRVPQALTPDVLPGDRTPSPTPSQHLRPAVPDVSDLVGDVLPLTPEPQTALPPYDTSKYRLGKLCPREHAYQGTAQSLRYRGSKRCIACDTEDAQARRKAARGSA